ncbi:MAG: SulP family inorganic anion transporter [Acidimicrobiales bacterium]
MSVLSRLPLVHNLADYRRRFVLDDLFAALVLTTLLIPAGMGYAQAAGLPAVTGLYATVTSLVVYALVGPSRVLVYGPDSSLVALIAAAVVPLSGGDPRRAVALAGLLAVFAGGWCLLATLARFGFLADLLSAPVRVGYLNGIAVTVIIRQLAPLLGMDSLGGNPLTMLGRTVGAALDGAAVAWAAGIGLASLAGIVVLRRLAPRFPATLLALVVPAIVGALIDLAGRGVPTVGPLPRGLPPFDWSLLRWSDVSALSVAAAGIAFVAFADTSVLSRTVALRRNDVVDANHELAALGAVNVVTGLSGGFAVSSSSSRTPVAEAAGSRSQLTGLFAAGLVVVVLLAAPELLRNVPTSALAAVVIMAAAGLADVRSWRRWAAARPEELLLSIGAFAAIEVLGAIGGIALAIGLSLLAFMRRAWRPHSAVLVRVDGLKGYHEAERHPEGRAVPGLVLYRFDAPLFFANAGFFVADLLTRLQPDTRQVTVTAEPITDIDATAAESLQVLLDELARRHVVLTFAELKGHVRDQLDAYGLVERIGRDRFARTVGEAVKRYVRTHDVGWQDWEDR